MLNFGSQLRWWRKLRCSMQNQGGNNQIHAKSWKSESKTAKGRTTTKILEVELEFVLVISRSLCLAVILSIFALLFVLLDSAPWIMHGLICGRQTNNWGYVNTYSYLCYTLHLCTFHRSICRPSSRAIHIWITGRHRLCSLSSCRHLAFPNTTLKSWALVGGMALVFLFVTNEYYNHCSKIARLLWTLA